MNQQIFQQNSEENMSNNIEANNNGHKEPQNIKGISQSQSQLDSKKAKIGCDDFSFTISREADDTVKIELIKHQNYVNFAVYQKLYKQNQHQIRDEANNKFDINNLLDIINGIDENIKKQFKLDKEYKIYFQKIKKPIFINFSNKGQIITQYQSQDPFGNTKKKEDWIKIKLDKKQQNDAKKIREELYLKKSNEQLIKLLQNKEKKLQKVSKIPLINKDAFNINEGTIEYIKSQKKGAKSYQQCIFGGPVFHNQQKFIITIDSYSAKLQLFLGICNVYNGVLNKSMYIHYKPPNDQHQHIRRITENNIKKLQDKSSSNQNVITLSKFIIQMTVNIKDAKISWKNQTKDIGKPQNIQNINTEANYLWVPFIEMRASDNINIPFRIQKKD